MNEVAYNKKINELSAIASMPNDRWPRSLDILGVPVEVIDEVRRSRTMAPARRYYALLFGITVHRAPRQRTSRTQRTSTPATPVTPAPAPCVTAQPTPTTITEPTATPTPAPAPSPTPTATATTTPATPPQATERISQTAYQRLESELSVVASMPADRWPRSLDILGLPESVIEDVRRRRSMAPARQYLTVHFVVREPRPYRPRRESQPRDTPAPVRTPAPQPGVNSLFARTFGIEIECYGATRAAITRAVIAQNQVIYPEAYNHRDRGVAKIVSDASLTGENTNEVVLPPYSDFDVLEVFCSALKSVGCKVNRSCGLHVHIDARTISPEHATRLINNYRYMYGYIKQILAPSRLASSFCHLNTQATPVTTWRDLLRKYPNRYQAVNVQAYRRHKTVEFRQHQGSLDFDKIKRWVTFCERLVEVSESFDLASGDSEQVKSAADRLIDILCTPVKEGRVAVRPEA